VKIPFRALAGQDESGNQYEGFVQAGTDPMLICCLT